LVVADQRILRLTVNELLNTVRTLIDDTEATALVADGIIAGGDSIPSSRRFPPLQPHDIDSSTFTGLDQVASHVGSYVATHFAGVTACASATDACASAYLDKLATRAYRRQPTADEKTRLTALYAKLRAPATVNGFLVTFTVEEAAGTVVDALLSSPQMLWRWELGDPTAGSTAPAGLPLSDPELATQLAFFFTDEPPDDTLIAAANAGMLRPNLAAHVDALLASPTARAWLRTIVETYLQLNQLPNVAVDPQKFPSFTPALAAEMATEARLFLDNALWNGSLTDLLLSRTTFLSPDLADGIYQVPVPSGATATNFVPATLPSGQRSGLLTNAAFLTTRARADGHGLVVPRGLLVDTVLLCMPSPGPDMPGPADPTAKPFALQTSGEQVAARAAPACSACHGQLDPYGLALDGYDNLGRYRTIDDLGQPVDTHATLPAALGGGSVANGVDLAQKLAGSPAFTNCMARTLLQYAMVDPATSVETPLPPQQAGCATADVVQRYQAGAGKTFADLVRATAGAPAFLLRRAAP
jgi:mono/diheme cytochrome c family protein